MDTWQKAGIGGDFGLSKQGGLAMCRPDETLKCFSAKMTLTGNGRAALGMVARYALSRAEPARNTVLAPAYLCPTMLQPFRTMGLQIRYYPLRDGVVIDPDTVAQCVDDRTLVVLTTHYFGFAQPEGAIRMLVDRLPDVLIVDDRTHLLLTDLRGNVPNTGAIGIYSARKWGPFPDLGLVHWPDERGARLARGYDWHFGGWRLMAGILRALFFRFPREWLRRFSLAACHRGEHILDQRVKICGPSILSRTMWHKWDWQAVCEQRRENYQHLLNHWTFKSVKPLFDLLPDSVCPLGFPVVAENRDELRSRLIKSGIFPPIHWISPDDLPAGQFPEVAALVAGELTIPTDQRYDTAHMNRILEAVERSGTTRAI